MSKSIGVLLSNEASNSNFYSIWVKHRRWPEWKLLLQKRFFFITFWFNNSPPPWKFLVPPLIPKHPIILLSHQISHWRSFRRAFKLVQGRIYVFQWRITTPKGIPQRIVTSITHFENYMTLKTILHFWNVSHTPTP